MIRHKLGSVVDEYIVIDSGAGRASLDTMIDCPKILLARTLSKWMLQA